MDNCCSICTEVFRVPKGLPCFHTFCQECLQMYIDNYAKNDSFKCPYCQARTPPFDSNKPKSEWAKGFPTNNYVINPNIELCHTHHNEPMDINCKTCRMIICYQCCLSSHENCEKILTEINAEKIKQKLLLHQQNLNLKLEFLEQHTRERNNIQERETTVTDIKEISEQLIEFVNNQKKNQLKKLKSNYLKESNNLQVKKKNIVKVMKDIKENIDDLTNLVGEESTDNGSLNQVTFDYKPKHVVIKNLSDIMQAEKEIVDFKINANFVKLKDDILQVDLVKRVKEAEPTPFTSEKTDEDVDEIEMEPDCLDQMPPLTLMLVGTVTLSGKSVTSVNDLVLLNDGCILLTDACYKTICKFSASGEFLQETSLDNEPFGLCLLQDNCVAVSQPSNKKILILDCGMLTEKDTLSFEKSYSGLGSDDKKKIFALYRDAKMYIDVISKSDPESPYEISHVINLPFNSCSFRRLRVLPSGLILLINSNYMWKLYCIDQNGDEIFLYEGDENNKLKYISDVAVSRHFIYVADRCTNDIHRIQHGGSVVDIPLTSSHDISLPKKVFVNDGGMLAVFSKNQGTCEIQLFSS